MVEKTATEDEIEIKATKAMLEAGGARLADWLEVPNDWLVQDLALDVFHRMLAAR